MALSTTPLLACESMGEFSLINLPPTSAFLRATSSTRCFMAGSWSDLTMRSCPSMPSSFMKAQIRSTTNFLELFEGTTVDIVMRVLRSRHTNIVIVLPASPSSPMKA